MIAGYQPVVAFFQRSAHTGFNTCRLITVAAELGKFVALAVEFNFVSRPFGAGYPGSVRSARSGGAVNCYACQLAVATADAKPTIDKFFSGHHGLPPASLASFSAMASAIICAAFSASGSMISLPPVMPVSLLVKRSQIIGEPVTAGA